MDIFTDHIKPNDGPYAARVPEVRELSPRAQQNVNTNTGLFY
jgi:hypothetical protein